MQCNRGKAPRNGDKAPCNRGKAPSVGTRHREWLSADTLGHQHCPSPCSRGQMKGRQQNGLEERKRVLVLPARVAPASHLTPLPCPQLGYDRAVPEPPKYPGKSGYTSQAPMDLPGTHNLPWAANPPRGQAHLPCEATGETASVARAPASLPPLVLIPARSLVPLRVTGPC